MVLRVGGSRLSIETDLKRILTDAVSKVLDQSTFTEWLESEDELEEGHIGINNSFIFREDLKTRKNAKFLCVSLKKGEQPSGEGACLASNIKFNKKFTYVSPKDKNAAYEEIDTALASALDSFGKIPLILIGTITDNVKVEAKVDHKLFARMIVDPAQKELVTVNDNVVFVREAQDEEAIWNALEEAARTAKIADPPLPLDLQQPFAKALGQLRSESYALVTLPHSRKGSAADGLLDDIVKVLDHQIGEYSSSLAKCKKDPQKNAEDFNSVLRISYNFSSDATKILRLLISLCDLKPVLFWCTVAEWFALSECFQNLPWSKSIAKPSLPAYQGMIGGARNRSFHNLFPFSKTLKVPLDGIPLGAISLTFFTEYSGRTNSNRFEYQDQALIEAFTEFTRAGEKFVPFSFWVKNLEVMARTVELLRAIGVTLRCLARHKEV